MKPFYKLIALSGLLCAFTACEETGWEEYPEFSTVVYLKESGLIELQATTLSGQESVPFAIGKGGTETNTVASANLTPFTAEEMETYNDQNRTDYVQLDASYYTLPANIEIGSNEEVASGEVIVDIAKIVDELDFKNTNYVLAMNLTSDAKVNDDNQLLIIQPVLTVPLIQFNSDVPAVQTYSQAEGEAAEAPTFSFPFYVDYGSNTTAFNIAFLTDEAALAGLVDQYNQEQDTEYDLLPAAHYAMPSSVGVGQDFVSGILDVQLKDLDQLEGGNYLLPIQMTGCDRSEFEISTGVRYIQVSIQKTWSGELVNITGSLSASDISGNNYQNNEGYDKLIDGNWGANSGFYQTQWSGNDHKEFTTEYGLSVNFDLGKVCQAVQFKYVSTRGTGNQNISRPTKIRFYGSMDGTSWTPISDEFTETEDGLPQHDYNQGEWWTSPTMMGSFKHLKLSVLEVKNNRSGAYISLTDPNTTGGCIISEIEIWAGE